MCYTVIFKYIPYRKILGRIQCVLICDIVNLSDLKIIISVSSIYSFIYRFMCK